MMRIGRARSYSFYSAKRAGSALLHSSSWHGHARVCVISVLNGALPRGGRENGSCIRPRSDAHFTLRSIPMRLQRRTCPWKSRPRFLRFCARPQARAACTHGYKRPSLFDSSFHVLAFLVRGGLLIPVPSPGRSVPWPVNFGYLCGRCGWRRWRFPQTAKTMVEEMEVQVGVCSDGGGGGFGGCDPW